MKFLLDPTWIAVLVALLTLIATTFFYYKSRQKKSLSYEVLSEYPLISVDAEIKGNLQVLFNDKPVGNLYMLLIRFINDGSLPISASDYERQLSMSFSDTTNILSAEYVSANPDNLLTSVVVDEETVCIKPVLMNPGDSFTVKVLISEYDKKFVVDTRIVGINSIKVARKQGRRSFLSFAAVTVVSILAAFLIYRGSIATGINGTIEFGYLPIRANDEVPVSLVLRSSHPDTRDLIFTWRVSRGSVSGNPNSPVALFHAPDAPSDCKLEVTISKSSDGRTVAQFIEIVKVLPSILPITIRFPKGDTRLPAESKENLGDLVKIMSENPSLRIEVAGHSAGGAMVPDLNLSERRAAAVTHYLVELGVASDRIKTIGYGGVRPIADNSTEQGKVQNRRVEIKAINY